MKRSGQSLLEGMVAALLLAIGVTTVMQAIILSSSQNAGAAKMSEAAALANQVVGSLQQRTFTTLTSTGNVFESPAACVTDGSLNDLTGGLMPTTTPYSGCVVDIDLFDLGAAPGRYTSNGGASGVAELVPGYDGARSVQYRRVAVLFTDSTSGIRIREGAVVVSFTEFGRRRFVTRMFSMTPSNRALPQL